MDSRKKARLDADIKRLRAQIADSTQISLQDKKLADDFYYYLQGKDISPRTTILYLYALVKFLPLIGRNGVRKSTREDVEKAYAKLNAIGLAPRTVRDVKTNVKFFYKHALGNDEFYPKQVSWFRAAKPRNPVLPEDLLTEDDVRRMLDACRNARDRAIIAVLYDSGVRVGELESIRKKDVDLAGNPAHITVNGKTGMRRIPVFFSAKYLSQYLESRKDLEGDDIIWRTMGTYENINNDASDSAIRVMLKKMAKRAGIKKNVHPHLFRHSRATSLANLLTEQQLKSYMGWTKDSVQASTYVHLSGRDIDNAFLKAHGQAPVETHASPKLTTRVCPRCQGENTANASYCTRCGSAMDIATAMTNEKMAEELEESAAKDMADEHEGSRVAKGYRRRRDAK